MTHKRPQLPGRTSGHTSASPSDPDIDPVPTRVLPLLLRPKAPPLALGLVVAALMITGESFLVYRLKEVAPGNIFGVVFLLGVLVVATVWGFWLGALTSLASAIVYVYFHHLQTSGSISETWAQSWIAVCVFLVVALSAATLAGVARSRAAEADQRRWQVEASHGELSVLAEQQTALRRVATLVARGADPSEVFAAVADELARCLHVVNAGLLRYEADGTGYVVAVQYQPEITTMPVTGEHIPLGGDDVGALVLRTGRAVRIDNHDSASGPEAARIRAEGIGSIVGVPVIVNGRLWGAAIVGSRDPEPLPPDTEARIGDFADLVATSIANAVARAELGVLAQRQEALRRVATLVARGVPSTEVYSAVALELAGVHGVQNASVWRYEPGGAATLLAARDEPGATKMPVGQRFSLEGDNIAAMVLLTGRPARMDNHDKAAGTAAAQIRELGLRGGVGAPIVVDGRLWGVAVVGSSRPEPLPPDIEARVADFADLVATAIANAQAHTDLTASRVRIVAAADDARRRIERDLHDGAQQRLVSLGLELRAAEAQVPPELQPLKDQISHLVSSVVAVSQDLQELSRGIHPAILSKGGLGPALKALARRSAVPVELDVAVDRRLPESAEVAAYYVVAEALTNAAKHAHASGVKVCASTGAEVLHLAIHDDGIGGADTTKGSGLIGLTDRVEAIGGQMTIASQRGSGTSLLVAIPYELR
jgi:signal transduction histidine kinase